MSTDDDEKTEDLLVVFEASKLHANLSGAPAEDSTEQILSKQVITELFGVVSDL